MVGVVAIAIGAAGAYADAQTSTEQTTREQHIQQRLDSRFAKLDSNHDGAVSRGEWRGRTALFDRLDANRDGVLSKDEIRPALTRRIVRRVAARRLLIGR